MVSENVLALRFQNLSHRFAPHRGREQRVSYQRSARILARVSSGESSFANAPAARPLVVAE